MWACGMRNERQQFFRGMRRACGRDSGGASGGAWNGVSGRVGSRMMTYDTYREKHGLYSVRNHLCHQPTTDQAYHAIGLDDVLRDSEIADLLRAVDLYGRHHTHPVGNAAVIGKRGCG